MGHLQTDALLIGLCLPSSRLINQAAYALDLAEADEPELSAFGWNALNTESARRLRNRLLSALAEPEGAGDASQEDDVSGAPIPRESHRATRIFDIYRQARDLMDTVAIYHELAFERQRDVFPPQPLRVGLQDLHQVLRQLRDAEMTVQLRRDALGQVGLHPSVPHRIRVVRGGLEWGITLQAATLSQLEAAGDAALPALRVATLKGELFTALGRLNRVGYLAYRADASHRARYNLEILEGHQPSLGIRQSEAAPTLSATMGR